MSDRPKITQHMIDLYDEYTHITLDRRAYMTKLTALVGSTAAAVTATSLIEAKQASAQIVEADDPRVKTERVTYPGEGGEMAGYLCMPANASGTLPAVIVIHENRRRVGSTLAKAGGRPNIDGRRLWSVGSSLRST